MFLVPDGPIPLKGVINPCCIPPLHEPQYPVSVFTIGICFTKLLVKLLPKFLPGKDKGEYANVEYFMPIEFHLD